MENRNRQVLLKRRPTGAPTTADFDIADGPMPDPGTGEALVRGIYLSLDPYMRGRISAVNMIFIGTSNEVGEFESGITAQWLGAVPAVIAGGVGTILIVIAWWHLFPALRNVDSLVAE